MPFQSEKQRRYLWANEPEIARDWTDTYGSGIAKALGGRIPFANGGDWLTMGNIGKYGGATVGGLGMGAGYQTLKDINQINKWSQMGYGNRNPVPQSMLKNLTGAYVPNQTFQKLGYGPGSLKGWLTSRVSPTHFGPVEAAMNVGKHLGTLGGTVATGIPLAYASLAGALQKNIPEELQGVISDDIISGGAMGAGAGQDVAWDTALKYGDPIQRSAFQDDYNYTSRDPMLAEYTPSDDYENINRFTETKDDDEGSKLWEFVKKVGRFVNPISGDINPLALIPRGGIANFANTMRGGLTQSGFERARDARRRQARIDNMLARKKAGKSYSQKNLNKLLGQNGGVNGGTGSPGGGAQAAGDLAGGSAYSSPFNRGGLAALWRE